MLIQQIPDRQMYSAYTPETSGTAFGAALWEIIRFPIIPEKVEDLINNVANRKTVKSLLTQEQYDFVRNKWIDIIDGYAQNNNSGLSLREFMIMVAELFGVDPDPDKEYAWPVSMSSVHRLITTADPKFKSFAVNLNKHTLEFVCQFSSVSYQSLLKLGEDTVIKYKQARDKEELERKPDIAVINRKSKQLDFILTNTGSTAVYSDVYGKPVESSSDANNLRTIVHNYLINNGYQTIVNAGVEPKELLELLYEPNPNISLKTLRYLLKHLSIDPLLFISLIAEDRDALNRDLI